MKPANIVKKKKRKNQNPLKRKLWKHKTLYLSQTIKEIEEQNKSINIYGGEQIDLKEWSKKNG